MIGFMLAAFMAPPHAPPVDQRLTDIENRLAAVESRLGMATASAPSSDAPTYHYNPPANFKVESGSVILDRQPSHVSYPNGPMQPLTQATTPVVQPQPVFYSAPPPVMYQQPMMRGGPLRSFGRGLFRGGANCSGSS